MLLIYTNENIEQQVVNALRAQGHGVLTSLEADNANRSIADEDVLAFGVSQDRILVTHNRLHFVRWHNHRAAPHAGVFVCSVNLDYRSQAQQIHNALQSGVADEIVRLNRP